MHRPHNNSNKQASTGSHGARDLRPLGALILGVVIACVGLSWRMIFEGIVHEELQYDPVGKPRVEVKGDRVIRGIYGIRPGMKVEEFLRNVLGLKDIVVDDHLKERELGDLCSVLISSKARAVHIKLGDISPRAAFLLGEPLDLNRAGFWDLQMLPHIGMATARKIVSFRRKHLGFSSPQQLTLLPRISNRTLHDILPLVTAGEQGCRCCVR